MKRSAAQWRAHNAPAAAAIRRYQRAHSDRSVRVGPDRSGLYIGLMAFSPLIVAIVPLVVGALQRLAA